MKKNWFAGIAIVGLLATGCEEAFVEVTDGMDDNSQVRPTGIERNVGSVSNSSGPGSIGNSSVQILPIVPQVSVPLLDADGLRLIYAHARNAPEAGTLDDAVIGDAFEVRLEVSDVDIERVEWYIDGRLFRDDDLDAPYNIRYVGVLPIDGTFDSDQGLDNSWRFRPGRTYVVTAVVHRSGGVSELEAQFAIESSGAPVPSTAAPTTTRPPTTVAPTTTRPPATTTTRPPTTAAPTTTTAPPTTTTAAAQSSDGRPIIMANSSTVLDQPNTIYDFNFGTPGDVTIAASNVEARNIRGGGQRRIGIRNGQDFVDSGFRNFEFTYANVQIGGGGDAIRPYFIDGTDVNAQPNVGDGDIMQMLAYQGDIYDPLIQNVTIYGKQRPAGSDAHNDGLQIEGLSGKKIYNPTIRNSHIEGASNVAIMIQNVGGTVTIENNTLSERYGGYHAVNGRGSGLNPTILWRNNTLVGGASAVFTGGWNVHSSSSLPGGVTVE